MSTFFPSGPGRVVQFNDPAITGSLIPLRMDNPITYEEHQSIITRVAGSPKVNAQLLHTIGPLVYAYVFGDRSSPLMISGLSMARKCTGTDERHGIEGALQWYHDFRASNYNSLIRVMIGDHGFDTLLLDFNFDIADAEAGIVQWSAGMTMIPERVG